MDGFDAGVTGAEKRSPAVGTRAIDEIGSFVQEIPEDGGVSGGCSGPDGGSSEGRIFLEHLVGAQVEVAVIVVRIVEAEAGDADKFLSLL